MDEKGEIQKKDVQFDIHARQISPWEVVTSEPSESTD